MKYFRVFFLLPILILCQVMAGCHPEKTNQLIYNEDVTVKSFVFADYQQQLEEDAYHKIIEPVPDADSAISAAKTLWLEEYGEPYDLTYGRPVSVFYDSATACWLIKGTLPINTLGSVPCALIQSDGTVLALWWD